MRPFPQHNLFGWSLALVTFAGPATAETFPYDHIHLDAPDPKAAANFYERYFGGRRLAEGPDLLMCGSTRFLFLQRAKASSIASAFRSSMWTRR